MSCKTCKDEQWRISLKFDPFQKIDPVFINETKVKLKSILPEYTSTQIDMIVENAIQLDKSHIRYDSRHNIENLSIECFRLKIPVVVNSMSPWK